MTSRNALLASIALALASGSGAVAVAQKPAPSAPATAKGEAVHNVSAVGNDAGVRVFRGLGVRSGNAALSPASLATAVAMAYAGARGATADEMRALFGFPADPSDVAPAVASRTPGDALRLDVANGLWVQQGAPIEQSFRALLVSRFAAEADSVDFRREPEARARINAWVEKKTGGKIAALVPPSTLGPATRLFLANAVYFKGRWQTPFDPGATESAPFHANGGSTDVPFMRRLGSMPYTETADFRVVRLAYEGGAEMVVMLPVDESGASLDRAPSADAIEDAVAATRSARVSLSLPRFTISTASSLAEPLAAAGMKTAFKDSADFSGISRAERLSISAVVQKVFVDVNEAGTEAAAATGMGVQTTSIATSPPIQLRIDRPFFFAIRDTASGALLFIGRVDSPKG